MKRSNWVRIVAVILIISMLAAPVSAAPYRGSDSVGANGVIGYIVELISDIVRDIFDGWFDKSDEDEPAIPAIPVKPSTPANPVESETIEPEETIVPSEPVKTESVKTESEKTESVETESEKTESAETESEKTESVETESEKTESVETESEKTESVETPASQQGQAQLSTGALTTIGSIRGNALGSLQSNTKSTPVEIALMVEGTHTITVDGDVSGEYSNTIVNVTTQFETERSTTANRATPASGLENGDYLIINADQLNKGYRKVLLNSTTESLLGFSSNVTVSDDKATVTDFANSKDSMVWTLAIDSTDASGNHSVSLTNPDGKNLYANGSSNSSTITVSDNSMDLTLERGDDYPSSDLRKNGWRVKFTSGYSSTYLNYTGSGAKTYNDANDDGNHWYFYKINETTTSTTAITFTANAVGETTVTIGGVDYHITVREKVDPDNISRDIPVNVLTPLAGDQHSEDEGAAKVLDGDNNTKWHTNWYGTSRDNHWIQFELSEEYEVDGLRYLPRQSDGSNGNITRYEILVSDDGQTFRSVATGTWDNNSSWKIAIFAGENVKYVRLVSLNAVSDNSYVFASAAEIRLTGTKVTEEPDVPVDPDRPGTQTVYFPVTMYNYKASVLNPATHQIEVEEGLKNNWIGMYFSDGNLDKSDSDESESYTYNTAGGSFTNLTWQQVMDGTYYADAACTNAVTVNTVVEGTGEYEVVTVDAGDLWATYGGDETDHWYVTDYKYYNNWRNLVPVAIMRQAGASYYTVGYEFYNGIYSQIGVYDDGDTLDVYGMAGTITGYTLTAGGETLATLDGTDLSAQVDVTLYTAGGEVTVEMQYAEWNFWNKKTGNNTNGDLFYTGLVEPELINDQIVFTVPEAGMFDDNNQIKDIYEYVGLPFVLDTTTGVYSFDSDANGAYFKGAPQSGTGPSENEMHKLHFAAGAPQPMPHDVSTGDGSENAFLPYNNSWTPRDDGRGVYSTWIDYHFGMRADLPFAMTPNGRVKSTDNESAPIRFTFSGDDDVWVFIDGHLVIDLGGIHNRLDATIDFAANTITYYEENSAESTMNLVENNETHSFNEPNFATTQKLFTDNEGAGIIPMSREAFATDADHEMQVFYLERGKGTSNARIEFNLPMSDTVIVTKEANKSWSVQAEKKDLENGVDPDIAGIDDLTASEQAAVDNIDFGFTLYEKTAGSEEFTPVANTNYNLIGRGVEGTVILSTDANGHFYLKNGQSAKFITELPTEGVTYYVVEDQVPKGFIAPDFKFAGEAAYNYTYSDGVEGGESGVTTERDASEIPEQIIDMPTYNEETKEWYDWAVNKSYEVTVKGSIEVQDSIEFKCINFMDAELPNPTAIANEDIIVIDYGLPVQIDPMANDIYRGDVVRIVYWGDENLTLDDYLKPTNGTVAAPKTEFDFGTVQKYDGVGMDDTVTRDTFTYTLNKQLTDVEVISYIIESRSERVHDVTHETIVETQYSLAKVYIVPATVMYYEENFSEMVTFTNSKNASWVGTVESDGASDYQEPGVVGTTNDSIYGSDVAYEDDSFDSNGTSYYGDTTDGALQFSYTFTGTGTTIFARTSATTGYIQVKLYPLDEEGNILKDENGKDILEDLTYRDTYWKDDNAIDEGGDTLYNIPVYTQEDLGYGTYKVVCTVAKAGTKTAGNDNGSGKDFYLDGIRIMQPLNEEAEDQELVEKALEAYTTDGEDNIDTVTLRYKLISDDITGDNAWNFAVLTDILGEVVNAEDYISIGPKEEVYLMPGQSVTFAVKFWHQDGYRMHMGMKAPFGNASVKVGKNTVDLSNATDCYYDITGSHAGIETKYEQAENESGYLLYTDDNGKQVYKTTEGVYCYADTHEEVADDVVLTPVYDQSKPYFSATYTFTATDSIVSLTNIKAVGNYSFILYEDVDIHISGNENVDSTDPGEEVNP